MDREKLFTSFRTFLGPALVDECTIERFVGTVDPKPVYDLWLVVERDRFHDAVAHLCANFNPHLSVISGDDLEGKIAFNYHFTTGWGERFGEATCTIRTVVPKDDLRLPTITDVLPGAQTAEREKREFYGIDIVGLPDKRNLFLPEDMTIHPWRNDLADETAKEVKRTVKWEERNE